MPPRKNDPMSGDDSGAESAIKDFERQSAEVEADDPEDSVQISLDDDDDEDEKKDDGLNAPWSPSRQEKKRARRNEFQATKREAEELRQRIEQQNQQLAQLSQQVAHTQGFVQGSAQPQEDPIRKALRATYEAEQELAQRIEDMGKRNPQAVLQNQQKLLDELQEIQSQRAHLMYLQSEQRLAPHRQQQQQQQFMNSLAQANPDVFSRPEYVQWGTAHYWQLVAEGSPQNQDTIAKALQATRSRFRLGKQPAPTQREKARYTAAPAGQGGAAGAGNGTTTITMTRMHQRAAEAMFPNDKPEVAHRKWAKSVGPNYAAKKAQRAG